MCAVAATGYGACHGECGLGLGDCTKTIETNLEEDSKRGRTAETTVSNSKELIMG